MSCNLNLCKVITSIIFIGSSCNGQLLFLIPLVFIKPSKLEKLLKLALKCGADLYQPFDDGFIIMQNLENDQMVKKIKQYMTRSNISMKQSDETECTICFTNKINTSVIPCGHTYCNTCLIQVQNCPHCRGPINGQHPIYISK